VYKLIDHPPVRKRGLIMRMSRTAALRQSSTEVSQPVFAKPAKKVFYQRIDQEIRRRILHPWRRNPACRPGSLGTALVGGPFRPRIPEVVLL